MSRPPREWNDLADVLQPRREQDEALEAQAEAGVGHGAIAPQVQVRAVWLQWQPRLREPLLEYLAAPGSQDIGTGVSQSQVGATAAPSEERRMHNVMHL